MKKHIILDQNEILIHKTTIHDHKIRWFNMDDDIYVSCSDLAKTRMTGKQFSNKFDKDENNQYRIYNIIHKTKNNYTSRIRYVCIDDIISRINFEGTIWKYIKQLKRR